MNAATSIIIKINHYLLFFIIFILPRVADSPDCIPYLIPINKTIKIIIIKKI